jgi:hypothetical protein
MTAAPLERHYRVTPDSPVHEKTPISCEKHRRRPE